ncbi:hypothetical protein ACSTJ1_00095, partial [Vibrio parahaemolyticus]
MFARWVDSSEVDREALHHIRRNVAEARALHDLELRFEHAGGVLILVGPFEPNRDCEVLEDGIR